MPRVVTLICGAGVGAAVLGSMLVPGGGGAISMAGARPSAKAGALAPAPNCCRTNSFMRADKSTPHVGHANAIGWRNISGPASKAYFAPQSQMTFMSAQGLGFSRITFERNGRSNAAAAGDIRTLPSVNSTLPPYL